MTPSNPIETFSRRAIVGSIAVLFLAMMSMATVAAFQATPAATPVAGAESITIEGAVLNPGSLTVTDLQAFPAETLEVTYEAGGTPEDHTFTGTPLIGVIETVGLDVPEDARNPLLATYLIVTAKDGYQVVISGGELDPNFGNVPMHLAWEQDGELLTGDDGPIRLAVPGDLRGGRYVHGIVSIEVVRLSGTP